MGSLAMASSSACCRPAASVAPGTMRSLNSAWPLPSCARRSAATAAAGSQISAPSACSFLSSAGLGWPAASSPTATGISFCCTARSGARSATALTWAARRRGAASGVTTDAVLARPRASNCSPSTAAKASPNFCSAFGGSSCTSSSTRRLRLGIFQRLRSSDLAGHLYLFHPGTRRHRKAQTLAALVVALRHGAGQVADARDVSGPLGHADGAARVEQVEAVRSLEHLLLSRQAPLLPHHVPSLLFIRAKSAQQKNASL